MISNAATADGVTVSLTQLLALRLRLRPGTTRHVLPPSRPAGEQPHMRLSHGMEYAESRRYQAGDDVRSIDWRQTARRGVPFTKLYHEESERPVHLLVDLGHSMRFGTRVAFKSVFAARAAALLAWQAVHDGDRIGGIVVDGNALRHARPQARERGALALLRHIADGCAAMPTSRETLAAALAVFRRSLHPGSLAIVVSDFDGMDTGMARCVAGIARQNEVVLVQVYDTYEAEVPPPALYPVSDGEQATVLDLRSAAARSAHTLPFAGRRLLLEKLARGPRTRLICQATHDDPAAVLTCLRSPSRPLL